jgi:hypothetical protein
MTSFNLDSAKIYFLFLVSSNIVTYSNSGFTAAAKFDGRVQGVVVQAINDVSG